MPSRTQHNQIQNDTWIKLKVYIKIETEDETLSVKYNKKKKKDSYLVAYTTHLRNFLQSSNVLKV